MRMIFFAVITGSMLLCGQAAQAKAIKQTPLQKISSSFSDDMLGRTTMPKGAKLNSGVGNSECSTKKLNDCYVTDINGLSLYFSPYDGLNRKTLKIGSTNEGSIRAAGIGTSRSKREVIAAVKKFTGGLNFDCYNVELVSGEKSFQSSCRAPIPEKWGVKAISIDDGASFVELVFDDKKDRIIAAEICHAQAID